MKRPLEVAYVQTILDKIGRTMDKYNLLIPEVHDALQEITSARPEDHFGAVVIVLQTIAKYESGSPFMKELSDGVRQDLWHGIDEAYEKHEGEFYITSVAD